MAVTNVAFGRLSGAPAMIVASAEVIAADGTSRPSVNSAPAKQSPNEQILVRIETDTTVYITFGKAPVATTSAGVRLSGYTGAEYFAVEPGDKVAVITGS